MNRFVFKILLCAICSAAMLMAALSVPSAPLQAKENINKDETLYLGAVRGFLWGTSIETVLENEKGTFIKREESAALSADNQIELEVTPLSMEEGAPPSTSAPIAPPQIAPTLTNQQKITRLFYDDKVYGRYAVIAYEFIEGQLARARVDIVQRSADPQGWFDLMMDAQLDLSGKFGAPISQNMIWRDETEKNYPPNWPAAMMSGDMDMIALWQGLAYPDVYAQAPKGSYDTRVELILKAPELFKPQLSFLYEKDIGIKHAKPAPDSALSQPAPLQTPPQKRSQELPQENPLDLLLR